jgi:hypothetical protein
VPVIFFKPDNSLSEMDTSVAQQIDIMPSILGHLNFDKPYVGYGRNVFDAASIAFAFNYRDEIYNMYEGEHLLMFDGKRSVSLYNFKLDKMLTTDLKKENPDLVKKLELRIKAIIQQYNNRMVEDKLTVN